MSNAQVEAPSSTQESKSKPGPKAKPKVDVEELQARVERLERCLEKVASNAGQGNSLSEYGLERWVPGKKDMTKYN